MSLGIEFQYLKSKSHLCHWANKHAACLCQDLIKLVMFIYYLLKKSIKLVLRKILFRNQHGSQGIGTGIKNFWTTPSPIQTKTVNHIARAISVRTIAIWLFYHNFQPYSVVIYYNNVTPTLHDNDKNTRRINGYKWTFNRRDLPIMARAVALVSLPLTPSRISSPDPSSLQRLMVLFPELIQYSCSLSKSMERPGKQKKGLWCNGLPCQ